MNSERGNSERGIALVMWMFIVLLVLFVIASVLGYTQFEQNTELQNKIDSLNAQIEDLQTRQLQPAVEERSQAFLTIGFGAKEYGEKSNLESAKQRMEELRGKFSTVTEADQNLESVLTGVEKEYDDLQRELENLKSNYAQAQQSVAAAEQETQAIEDAKDAELQNLRDQLQSEADRNARAQKQSQGTIDQQRDRITTLETEIADRTEEWRRERNELLNKALAMEAIARENIERNRLLREKRGADGRVVSADPDLRLVYLDIGAKHGLKRGTPFTVWTYGKGKVKESKGRVEVREVYDDYAEAGVTFTVDPFRPIVEGDYVSNIYFDRDKAPVFVFLGELRGRYNNAQATNILRSKGARVEQSVTSDTDFLVVGEVPAGQDDVVLEETETFKLAELFGVEMIGAEELLQYIRY